MAYADVSQSDIDGNSDTSSGFVPHQKGDTVLHLITLIRLDEAQEGSNFQNLSCYQNESVPQKPIKVG